jgi:hypothetical protein
VISNTEQFHWFSRAVKSTLITEFLSLSRKPLSFIEFKDQLFSHEMLLTQQQAPTPDRSSFALFTHKPNFGVYGLNAWFHFPRVLQKVFTLSPKLLCLIIVLFYLILVLLYVVALFLLVVRNQAPMVRPSSLMDCQNVHASWKPIHNRSPSTALDYEW